MMSKAMLALVLSLGIAAFSEDALAQTTQTPAPDRSVPTKVGEVKTIEGPQASVIVVRGSQAYALLPGDALFLGDRILTRTNGRVALTAYDCEKTLEPTASIVIDEDVCKVAPIMVAGGDSGIEAALPPAGPGGTEVGAAPTVLGLLAAAGGAASALGSNQSSTTIVQ